jgi:hypothetical protein
MDSLANTTTLDPHNRILVEMINFTLGAGPTYQSLSRVLLPLAQKDTHKQSHRGRERRAMGERLRLVLTWLS